MNKFLIALLLLPLLTTAQRIDTDFSNGDRTAGGVFNFNSSGLACTPDCMKIVDGKLRSVLRATDPICGSSKRCEGQHLKDSTLQYKYFRYDMTFVNYDSAVANHQELCLQMKTSTTMYPPVSIFCVPVSGVMRWQLRIVADSNNFNNTEFDSAHEQVIIDLGPIISNQVVKFEFEIDWHPNHRGVTKVKINDVLKAIHYGPNMNKPYDPNRISYHPARFGPYAFGYGGPGPFNVPWRQILFSRIVLDTQFPGNQNRLQGLFLLKNGK